MKYLIIFAVLYLLANVVLPKNVGDTCGYYDNPLGTHPNCGDWVGTSCGSKCFCAEQGDGATCKAKRKCKGKGSNANLASGASCAGSGAHAQYGNMYAQNDFAQGTNHIFLSNIK